MKFIISLALLIPYMSLASSNPYTFRVDTSSTNLSSSFTNAPQLLGPPTAISTIQVYNGSASEIEVNCSSTAKPGSLATNSIFVPGTTGYQSIAPSVSLVTVPFEKMCYIRSVSGTISSGVIELVAWGY